MANRYQREIEEILEKANAETPSDTKSAERGEKKERKPRVTKAPRPASRPRFTISSGKLMLLGIALLLLSLPFGIIYKELTAPMAWVGIGLLIGGYVLYFARPRRPYSKRWRGEVLEDDPGPNSFARFWRWLTRG